MSPNRSNAEDTGRRHAPALFVPLLIGALCSACFSVGKEAESLDPAQLESDEGVVVARFLTARADADDLEHAESDPDFTYHVTVGSSKSMMLNQLILDKNVVIDAGDGPVLIVRTLEAGDYYFTKLHASGGKAPMAVKFTVQPGRVTYIGDLNVLFVVDKGFLWSEELSCRYGVTTDLPAVMESLRSRYSMVPVVETVPMVVERPGF